MILLCHLLFVKNTNHCFIMNMIKLVYSNSNDLDTTCFKSICKDGFVLFCKYQWSDYHDTLQATSIYSFEYNYLLFSCSGWDSAIELDCTISTAYFSIWLI